VPTKTTAAGADRVLLLGGTSEIGLAILAALPLGPDAEVVLAGRDERRLAAVAAELPYRATAMAYQANALDTHTAFADAVFAGGGVDLVIAAFGVLVPQEVLDQDPLRAGMLVETDFTAQVTTLLALAGHLRAQGSGTLVVLSSIAAVRPRRANYVYGAAKAGLDAFARGLTDALRGSGVRVLLVRPGFVIGRMTEGMSPAPLSSTPAEIGTAVAGALGTGASTLWVPRRLAVMAALMRLTPRPLWRGLRR